MSVRTACNARLCVLARPATWVPIVAATLLPLVMRKPVGANVSGLSSVPSAVPDFAVTVPSVTLMVSVSAYVSRNASTTVPLSAGTKL